MQIKINDLVVRQGKDFENVSVDQRYVNVTTDVKLTLSGVDVDNDLFIILDSAFRDRFSVAVMSDYLYLISPMIVESISVDCKLCGCAAASFVLRSPMHSMA